MPYTNTVFVKLFLSLFEEYDRFLYQLNESQQLLYIKLLYMAGATENKIGKNLKFISDKINYHHEKESLKADIKRIREVFPRFVEGKEFYYFENFEKLRNWRAADTSKMWKDKDGARYGSSRGSSQTKKKSKNKKEDVDMVTPTEDTSSDALPSEELSSGTSSATSSGATSEQMTTLVEQWNNTVPRKVNRLTPWRIEHLAARMAEVGFVENFSVIAAKVAASDFLSGKKPSKDKRDWKATFDWVIKDSENWVKVFEGKYDNGKEPEVCRV